MGNVLKARGTKQSNNLFRMLIKMQPKNDANLATTSNLKRWHEHLGHINYKYIQQLQKTGLITGSAADDKNKDLFCEAC